MDISIEGIATLKDKVTPTLKRMEDKLEDVSDEMEEGSATAEAYRSTLERLIPENDIGSEAKIVEKALDDMIDSGNIGDAMEWKAALRSANRSVRSMKNESAVSGEVIERLGNEMADASVKAGAFRHEVENAVNTKTTAQAELLGKAIDDVVESGDIGDMQALNAALMNNSVATGISKEEMERLHREIDNVGDEAMETGAQMQGMAASAAAAGAAAKAAADDGDNLDDVFEKIGFSSARLSADLGFLNISLQNLVKTLPQLGIVLGSITKAFGGMAIAAVGAGGAFAGLMAGGMLGWAQALDQQFASVEGTSEGMMIIMEALGAAIQDALQPLVYGELADGTSVMQAFMDVLGGIVDVVRVLAVGFEDILSLPEVQDFMEAIGGSMLGADAQTGGLAETMDALRDATALVLPLVQQFLMNFGARMPSILESWSEAADGVGEEFIQFFGALFDLLSALADFGVIVGQEVLPHLTGITEFAAQVVKGLNDLDNEAVRVATSMLLMAFAASEVASALRAIQGLKIVGTLTRMSIFIGLLGVSLLELTGTLDEAKTAFKGFLSLIPGIDREMADSMGSSTAALGLFITAIAAGSKKIISNFGAIKKAFKLLKVAFLSIRNVGFIKWLTINSTKLARLAAAGSRVAGVFVGLGSSLSTLVGVFSSTGSILNTLAAAFGMLAAVVGGFAAAIAVIIGAIIGLGLAIAYMTGDLQKAAEEMEWLGAVFNAIANPVETVKGAMRGVSNYIKQTMTDFDGLVDSIMASKSEIPGLNYTLIGLAGIIKGTAAVLKILADMTVRFVNDLVGFGDWLLTPFQMLYDAIKKLEALKHIIKIFASLIKWGLIIAGVIILIMNPILLLIPLLGMLIAHWDGIKEFFEGIYDWTVKAADGVGQFIDKWTDLDNIMDTFAGPLKEMGIIEGDSPDSGTHQTGNQLPMDGPAPTGSGAAGQGRGPGNGRNQTVVNNETHVTVNGNASKADARETAKEVTREQERHTKNKRGR